MTPRDVSMSLWFFGGGVAAAAGGFLWLGASPGEVGAVGGVVLLVSILYRAWIGARMRNTSGEAAS